MIAWISEEKKKSKLQVEVWSLERGTRKYNSGLFVCMWCKPSNNAAFWLCPAVWKSPSNLCALTLRKRKIDDVATSSKMHYIVLVLTCVLLGLNCSQLCVSCCSSMERRGEAAAAFIPLHSTAVGSLASEQHTDWPVCPGQSGTSAAAGVNWITIPLTALNSCRKPGWRIGRAAKWEGGDMWEVKGSLCCHFFLLLQLAGQAERGTLTSCLYWFFLFSIRVTKADIELKSLQPHVLDLENNKRCQRENNAPF